MDLGVPEAIGLSWHVSQEELKRIESVSDSRVNLAGVA